MRQAFCCAHKVPLQTHARMCAKKEEEETEKVKRASKSVGKKIALALLSFRKVTPAGLVGAVATGAAIEVARVFPRLLPRLFVE